jgi:hypothetical protein
MVQIARHQQRQRLGARVDATSAGVVLVLLGCKHIPAVAR